MCFKTWLLLHPLDIVKRKSYNINENSLYCRGKGTIYCALKMKKPAGQSKLRLWKIASTAMRRTDFPLSE